MSRKIIEHVDQHAQQSIEFVRHLVKVPSDNPLGDCTPHARVTRTLLEKLGFEVEAHEVPSDLVRSYGMVSATNLVVRHCFGDGPIIALNAHGDVVAPGGGWSVDPYAAEVKDGWIYGRGAGVSKSDMATYAYALRALIDTGVINRGTVELHFTYDEEIGGHVGPAWLLSEGITRPDYAVCAAFSYSVITAHCGRLHLEVSVLGKSAHVAYAHTGVDAIRGSCAILDALYGYGDKLRTRRSAFSGIESPSVLVGMISGGFTDTVVADEVKFHVDRRILPDEDPDVAEADLRRIIEEAARAFGGIKVTISRLLLARPFVPVEGASRLANVFCRIASEFTGQEIKETAIPLATDARHYAEAGIPAIMYGAGPADFLDANAHRADERVPIDTIPLATKVVASAICDLVG